MLRSETFKSLRENKYYQIFWRTATSFALFMALAQTDHTPRATADTIPEPPPAAPALGDLDCSAFYELLKSAEIEVFGQVLEINSAASTQSEQNEELPTGLLTEMLTSDPATYADADSYIQYPQNENSEPAALADPVPWMLPVLNRPTNPHLEFKNNTPITKTYELTLAQSSEIISFTASGGIRVIADSGVPTYPSQIRLQAIAEKKLISGPNLVAKYYLGKEICESDDDHDHSSGEYSIQFDDAPVALVQLGEEIPFTEIYIKALDFGNNGQWISVIESILLAGKLQASALSISIGGNAGPETQAKIQKAIDYAASQGTVIFAAAGNSNSPPGRSVENKDISCII